MSLLLLSFYSCAVGAVASLIFLLFQTMRHRRKEVETLERRIQRLELRERAGADASHARNDDLLQLQNGVLHSQHLLLRSLHSDTGLAAIEGEPPVPRDEQRLRDLLQNNQVSLPKNMPDKTP